MDLQYIVLFFTYTRSLWESLLELHKGPARKKKDLKSFKEKISPRSLSEVSDDVGNNCV